jgi:beta-glucosidase/6-phospho-beta-glucosidase/beta-galactosidase
VLCESCRYHPAEIIITENGYSANEDLVPYPENLNDTKRIEWYSSYLAGVVKAVEVDKVRLRAPFCVLRFLSLMICSRRKYRTA